MLAYRTADSLGRRWVWTPIVLLVLLPSCYWKTCLG